MARRDLRRGSPREGHDGPTPGEQTHFLLVSATAPAKRISSVFGMLARRGYWRYASLSMARLAPRADHDDLIVVGQVDLLHRHLDAQHLGLEWHVEVLVEHRVESHHLLGFIVGVDRRLLYERVEFGFRDLRGSRPLVAAATSDDAFHHLAHFLGAASHLDTSVRPTAWLAISDSNFDVQREYSSL